MSKFKKTLELCVFVTFLFLVVGCSNNSSSLFDRKGQTYRISYVYDKELLENLKPDFYVCGEETILPELEFKGFVGWYDNKRLEGDIVSKITENDYGHKVFYAKVEIIKETYTISYFNGDESLDLNPKTYQEGDSVLLPVAPSIEGKDFKGWYTDSNFKNVAKDITSEDRGNKVFYAKYIDHEDAYIPIVPQSAKRLNDVIKEVNKGNGITRGIPSTGTVNVLVIPVDFTNYKADNDTKETLEKALFGTSEDTGWESLSSYYQKTSYGLLNIQGTVTDVYSTNKKSTYFDNIADGEGVYEIIKGALEYFDEQIDYQKFDNDSDGYIDAIYFVYTCPVEYDDSDSIYWAFTDEYITEGQELYDQIEADYYTFVGYDFLFETPESGEKLTYNCETFIHETGHLLGLDDYYDYDDSDNNNIGGIGGGDMMDYNVGDHNAYSKTIMNWITPTVIETSKLNTSLEFTLNSFGESGEAIILAKTFNDTFYTEYFIIDYYTPDGLNELEAGNNRLFSKSGIRIYHVSSTLASGNIESVWDMTKYNNATSKYKLIELEEADGRNDISKGKESSNSDLFQSNKKINNLKWNNGESISICIQVVSISETEAKIIIENMQ